MEKKLLVIVGSLFEYKREGYAKSFDLAMKDFVILDGITIQHAEYLEVMRGEIEEQMGVPIRWIPGKSAVRVLSDRILEETLGLRKSNDFKAAVAAGVRVLRLRKSKRKHLSELGGIQNGEKELVSNRQCRVEAGEGSG